MIVRPMTAAQREAHERMLAKLPVTRVGDMNDHRNWKADSRPLSPDELAHLRAKVLDSPTSNC